MVKCSKCQQIKEITSFSKNKSRKNGLAAECKQCCKERSNKLYQKQYREDNKYRLNLKKKFRFKKYLSNSVNRLIHNQRVRIDKFLKGLDKSKTTMALLGCNQEFLIKYIESQFQPGMTWDNYGEWHIDHKFPLSLAKTKEEVEKLCHYLNLQPLWKIENILKSNKVG